MPYGPATTLYPVPRARRLASILLSALFLLAPSVALSTPSPLATTPFEEHEKSPNGEERSGEIGVAALRETVEIRRDRRPPIVPSAYLTETACHGTHVSTFNEVRPHRALDGRNGIGAPLLI